MLRFRCNFSNITHLRVLATYKKNVITSYLLLSRLSLQMAFIALELLSSYVQRCGTKLARQNYLIAPKDKLKAKGD